MSKAQRILTTGLWGLVVVMLVALIASWTVRAGQEEPPRVASENQPPMPDIMVPTFGLINQDAEPVNLNTLKGQPWIADFVFTRCKGPCPVMTATMAKLRKEIEDPRVQFVSFSVDPEYDTPMVLKEYKQAFYEGDRPWHFLTGPVRTIYSMAAGMKLVAMPAEGERPIIHSEKLVLVDPTGRVYGYYSSTDPDDLKNLVRDAEALVEGDGV